MYNSCGSNVMAHRASAVHVLHLAQHDDTGHAHHVCTIIVLVRTHPASICAPRMHCATQPSHWRSPAAAQPCCPLLQIPAPAAQHLLLRPLIVPQMLAPTVET